MNDAIDVEWESHRTAGRQALREYKEAAAIEEYRAALRIAESFGSDDPRLVTSLGDLATAYERDRRFGEVAKVTRRLLGLLEQAHGSASTELVSTLHQLARATQMLGDDEEAERLLQRALVIQERALGPNHATVTWSLHALALLNLSRKRFADAEAFWLRAEPIAVAARSQGDNQALGQDAILDCLILVYRAWPRPELMEATARRRLELAEDESDHDLRFGAVHSNLAEALEKQKRYAEAADAYRAAILCYQRWFRNSVRAMRRRGRTASSRARLRTSGNQQIAWLRHDLARVLRQVGETEDADCAERLAEMALRRALAAREQQSGADDIGDVSLVAGLAEIYVARGKPEAAEPLFRRAIAIYEQETQDQIDRLAGPENARGRARMRAVLESSTARLRRKHAAVLRALGRRDDRLSGAISGRPGRPDSRTAGRLDRLE